MKVFSSRIYRRLSSAFTLIETLVVVSIIVLILAMSAPSLMQSMNASKLSSAGDSVVGFFGEAQQMAMSQNLPVEVRFFKYKTPLNEVVNFRAYQMFKVTTPPATGGGTAVTEVIQPVGTMVRFPTGIVLLDNTTLSPALTGSSITDRIPGGDGTYSGVQGAEYCALRFMTDGSCRQVGVTTSGIAALVYQTLPTSFVTLIGEQGDQVITAATLPKNFYTIQVDPFTGKTRTYRPGAN